MLLDIQRFKNSTMKSISRPLSMSVCPSKTHPHQTNVHFCSNLLSQACGNESVKMDGRRMPVCEEMAGLLFENPCFFGLHPAASIVFHHHRQDCCFFGLHPCCFHEGATITNNAATTAQDRRPQQNKIERLDHHKRTRQKTERLERLDHGKAQGQAQSLERPCSFIKVEVGAWC
jgi:hypothetical protein